MTQSQLADSIGMKRDAMSRALNGERAFSARELVDIAQELDQDVHFLITGAQDPNRFVVSARHGYDVNTRSRTLPDTADDEATLNGVALAIRQALDVLGAALGTPTLPRGAHEARSWLGEAFVRPFADRLEALGVDVVRVTGVSTAYSMRVAGRPVIVLNGQGQWARENWNLAHEFAHLALGHEGVHVHSGSVEAEERAANAFAAELLLPEAQMREVDWSAITDADLAERVWEWGVSTHAIRMRLQKLGIVPSARVAASLEFTTAGLIRRYRSACTPPPAVSAEALPLFADPGDEVTKRITDSGVRRFPRWLIQAHVDAVGAGKLAPGTLAWMLDVDESSIDVGPPENAPLSDADLMSFFG